MFSGGMASYWTELRAYMDLARTTKEQAAQMGTMRLRHRWN